MKNRYAPCPLIAFLMLFSWSQLVTAQANQTHLQAVVDRAIKATIAKFADKKLDETQVALTIIDLTDPASPSRASFRGNERFYPASAVKLFYLVAVERWLEDKRLRDTPELQRALRDMVVDSSNDATHYIVDVLTQTTGGFELPPEEMKAWQEKRNAVNRYYSSLGFGNINVNQKTFCEDAYGRENISRGPNGENRNKLTTDATARLLMEIVTGRSVSTDRSQLMMQLLQRDPRRRTSSTDSEDTGFSGTALPAGAKLWSKAGWTSAVRHDAAYIELPTGEKFVVVIFTNGHSSDPGIIPTLVREVIGGITKKQ